MSLYFLGIFSLTVRQQLEKMFALVPDGSGHPWHQYGFPHCCETGPREPSFGEDESSAGFSSMSYESESTYAAWTFLASV
jgi:hypothetical protein